MPRSLPKSAYARAPSLQSTRPQMAKESLELRQKEPERYRDVLGASATSPHCCRKTRLSRLSAKATIGCCRPAEEVHLSFSSSTWGSLCRGSPANSAEAITHLEELRFRGLNTCSFRAPRSGGLTTISNSRSMNSHYREALSDEDYVLYVLSDPETLDDPDEFPRPRAEHSAPDVTNPDELDAAAGEFPPLEAAAPVQSGADVLEASARR